MKRFLVYATVVVALVALTGPAMAQYSTGTSSSTTTTANPNNTNQNMTDPPTTTTTASSSAATQGTVDQNTTTTTSGTSTTTDTNHNMPRTASPLPLIAMSGILTLVAGMWISRRRRSA
jgi:cobalamin biosynthesis Mg chelatase CobN